jgi:hypothetical protein
MSALHTPPDPLTLPFLASADLRVEFAHLPTVALVEHRQDGPLELATFIAQFGAISGTITLRRRRETLGWGTVSFAGGRCVDLAFGMTSTMGLLPIEIVRSTVVSSPDSQARLAALQIMALIGDQWPTAGARRDGATAIRAAIGDGDLLVRSYAPVALAAARLPGSAHLLEQMRSNEREPAIIDLINRIEPAVDGLTDVAPPASPEPERLELPVVPVHPTLEEALALFPPAYVRTSVQRVGPWAVAALLDEPPSAACARVMLGDLHAVGGVEVSGGGRAHLAYQIARRLRMLPISVVELTAVHGEEPAWRDLARIALAWVASEEHTPTRSQGGDERAAPAVTADVHAEIAAARRAADVVASELACCEGI